MKLNHLIPQNIGAFLKSYIANYTNKEGELKDYEIVSRRELRSSDDLSKKQADAVTIIVFSDDNEKILLQKEFRMTINDFVWSFPAGLIDDGESPIESARRELKEETGLDLIEILYIQPPCYTSVGLSNEMIVPVYCKATGNFQASSSAMEEIEAHWFTKEEAKNLILETESAIKENKSYIGFTNRVSAVLYNWCGLI